MQPDTHPESTPTAIPVAAAPDRHAVLAGAPQDAEALDALARALGDRGDVPHPERWSPGGEAPSGDVLIVVLTPRLVASGWPFSDAVDAWIRLAAGGEADVITVVHTPLGWRGTPLGTTAAVAGPAGGAPSWAATAQAIAQLLAGQPADAAPPPTDAPTPAYEDEPTRQLGERLAALHLLRDDPDLASELVGARAALRGAGWLVPGDILGDGRYRLLDRLGEGASGTVWRAWDTQSRAAVALKALHPHVARDPQRAEAFSGGASRTAGLDHPHLAPVLDHGAEGRVVYAVTPHLPGASLGQRVRAGALGGASGAQAVLELTDAVAHLHDLGIVHGAIRPSNVLFDASGRVVLTGACEGDPTGATLYDPPEGQGTAKADQFALGMTALLALSGAPLPRAVLRDPTPIVAALPVPPAARQAIARAIEWEPDARHDALASVRDAFLGDAALVRELADAARHNGRLAVSVQHLERLTELAPDERVQILAELGAVHVELGDDDAAFAAFAAALDQATAAPDVASLLDRMRELSTRAGRHQPLVDALTRQLDRGDVAHRASCAVELARVVQRAEGDTAGAEAAWRRVLDAHTEADQAREALQALRGIARASADGDAEVAWTTELLPYLEAPSQAAAEHAIGMVHLERRDDPDAALEWFERAVAHGFDAPGLTETRERLRASRGEWAHVVALMRERAARGSGAVSLSIALKAAHIARAVHLDVEADAIYARLLEEAPSFGRALRHMARHHRAAGRPDAAREHYARLIDTFEQGALPPSEARERALDLVAYATLLADAGQTDAALEHAHTALRHQPASVAALRLVGPLALDAGDLPTARSAFAALRDATAHELDPLPAAAATTGLGEVEWAIGRLPGARDAFADAAHADPDDATAWWGLAKVALTARATQDTSLDKVPWLAAAPVGFTVFEALARLLSALLDPHAMRTWLALDPFGARLADATHPLQLAAATVDVLRRRALVDASLIDRIEASFPEWSEPIGHLRHLVHGASAGAPGLDSACERWTRQLLPADFHPARPIGPSAGEVAEPPRRFVPARPPRGLRRPASPEQIDDAAWAALLAPHAAQAPPADEELPAPDQANTAPLPVSVGLRGGAHVELAPGQRASVGSAADADLRVQGGGVRPSHCTLFRAGDRLYVDALGDATLAVGGVVTRSRRLEDGDALALGATVVRVAIGRTTVSAAPAASAPVPAPDAPTPAAPAPVPSPEAAAAPAPAPAAAEPVVASAADFPPPPADDDPPTDRDLAPIEEPSSQPAVAVEAVAPPPVDPPPPAPASEDIVVERLEATPGPIARAESPTAATAPPAPPVDDSEFDWFDAPDDGASASFSPAFLANPPAPSSNPTLIDAFAGDDEDLDEDTATAPFHPAASLLWKEGSMEANVEFDRAELRIGTRDDDHIVLTRPPGQPPGTIVRLYRTEGQIWCEDFRSAPAVPRELQDGALFTIENQLFRLNIDGAPAPEPEPEPADEVTDAVIGARVEVCSGSCRGTVASVGPDGLTVGHGVGCDISVKADAQLATVHFVVEPRGATFYLVNHAKKGGTAVNGTRVEADMELFGGETVMAGHTVFRFLVT